jgi:hypothetical protein
MNFIGKASRFFDWIKKEERWNDGMMEYWKRKKENWYDGILER